MLSPVKLERSMVSLRCAHCEYVKSIPTMKTRLAGLGIASSGVFGWVSFMFVGSGHTFLICCLIFFSGAFNTVCPDGVAKAVSESQECVQCSMKVWENAISWIGQEDGSRLPSLRKPVPCLVRRRFRSSLQRMEA